MEIVLWSLIFTLGTSVLFVLGLYITVWIGFGFFELLRKIGLIS